MNHHTSSRLRKNGNSSDRMKKWPKDRSCSTHSNIHASLLSNSLGKVIPSTGVDLIIKPSLQYLLLVIINMESLVALEAKIGILQVETLVGGIIKIVGHKAEVIVVGHIHLRDEPHLILVVGWLPVFLGDQVVAMVFLLITPKVVNMEVLVQGEVQTK